jgi:SOS-response transcriptional repressor LexA
MSVRVMSLVWEFDLPTSEKMVLLVIADHADDGGMNAWPSIATIARKASVSPRQAQRLVKALADSGFLFVEGQAGGTREMRDDRRPNRYTVNLNGVSPMSSRTGERGDTGGSRGDTHDANGVTPMSPKPSIEPSLIEPPISIAHRQILAEQFDEFWDVYPRRVGKVAAEKAFRKSADRVDPLEIIAGARRYAEDPNREPEFTAHPTSWLNAGRWDDELIPAKGRQSGTRAYLEAAEALSGLYGYLELEAGNERS